MKAEIKIPIAYNPESLILSMQTLKLDPNFGALCAMMKANDIETMEKQLIKGKDPQTQEKLSDEEVKDIRYRLEVFEEMLAMPDTIIENMQTERKAKRAEAEDERSDPFFTEEDINKSREGK